MQQRFKYIFGLSMRAPECLSGVNDLNLTPADVTRSETGIYLDEMDNLNLNMLDALSDCSIGSIWDLMSKARNSALKELETSLLAGLSTVAKQRRQPYYGFIGQPNHNGLNPVSEGSRQSLVLRLPYLDSVTLKIKRIGLLVNAEATVGINTNATTEAIEVVVTPNTASYYIFKDDQGKPKPLEVAMNGQEIEFSYLAAGFKPYNNLTSCGCGIKDTTLAEFFRVGNAGPILNQPAAGIILDVEISCAPNNMVFLNYDQDLRIANVLAYAARYKAAELLVERILNSDMINRYTMLEPEYLFGKRNHFRKEYQDRINWLISADGLDMTKDSCYVCKTASGFRKVGILS